MKLFCKQVETVKLFTKYFPCQFLNVYTSKQTIFDFKSAYPYSFILKVFKQLTTTFF